MAPLGDEVQFLLGRLEAKLDSVLASLSEHKQHTAGLEARIAKLESWRWFVVGGATALSTLASYALHLLR